MQVLLIHAVDVHIHSLALIQQCLQTCSKKANDRMLYLASLCSKVMVIIFVRTGHLNDIYFLML